MADSKKPSKPNQSDFGQRQSKKAQYGRAYYLRNRERILASCKEYRERNKEAKRARDKAYYEANKKKILAYNKSPKGRAVQKKSREANREKLRERHREWRENNREHLRAYKKRRREQNPHIALINRVTCRTWGALRSALSRKSNRTLELVGCTAHELAEWIGSQFSEGMCWERLGEIHIDHVIPLAAFDLSDPEQQRAAFHYTNLRPMWGIDNKRKSDKVSGQVLFGFAYAAKIADGMTSRRQVGRRRDATRKHSDD